MVCRSKIDETSEEFAVMLNDSGKTMKDSPETIKARIKEHVREIEKVLEQAEVQAGVDVKNELQIIQDSKHFAENIIRGALKLGTEEPTYSHIERR